MLVLQAQQYAALRKPYLINDMLMQDILLDRRKVYQQLQVSSEEQARLLFIGSETQDMLADCRKVEFLCPYISLWTATRSQGKTLLAS